MPCTGVSGGRRAQRTLRIDETKGDEMVARGFLPGVAVDHVLERLAKAGGKELDSGKFFSPESSAALAVNTFGRFVDAPADLPPFPGVEWDAPPIRVEVEYCARFPWAGGRHPWLDAMVETPRRLFGIESKRFEPFRDAKRVVLSTAYDRPVWGDAMRPFEAMRDRLRSRAVRFEFVDAAQLVKHAFGLVTDSRRLAKTAGLIYLFAEPRFLQGKPIEAAAWTRHRQEIAEFGAAVDGAAVAFHAVSYREWLASWASHPPHVAGHAGAVLEAFEP